MAYRRSWILPSATAVACLASIGAVNAQVANVQVANVQAACAGGEVAFAGACRGTAEVADAVRAIVRDAIERDGLKAVIAGVEIGGVPVVNEAWGESMTGVPATPDMHFRNGAIAIPYLTTVLLQLQDEGVLRIDDPLSKWLPDAPGADRVTLAMLARNTSGYPDYVDLSVLPLYDDPFRAWTSDELVALAFGRPMACAPGACFAYSHANYVILGEALAAATGRDVADLIRERIVEPLGLHGTRSETTAAIPEPVLHAFTDERGIYEDSTYWNPSWTLARGAVMTTTVPDAVASAVAIGTGSLLSQESYAAMIASTPITMAPQKPGLFYGLGVIVANGWILQTPSFGGYAAVMAYLPGPGIAIAVSTTAGPATQQARATNRLFAAIATLLAPDHAPPMFGS